MPVPFILAIIFAVLALICTVVWRVAKPTASKTASGGYEPAPVKEAFGIATAGWAGLTLLMLLFASWTQVSTQNIGILTSFGRPVAHLSNGLHFTAPWENETDIDGAIQTQSFENNGCVQVRIGEQQTACADVIIRWRVEPGAADQLFRNYHGGASVLVSALNASLDAYNPVAATAAAPGSAANPHLSVISAEVAAQMRSDLNGQISVLSVVIPRLVYQGSVQARINQEDQQVAQTIIANEAIRTAQAQASANKILSQSVSGDPNVLVAQCMNVLEALQKSGSQIPAGFSCWPINGAAVLAGSK
jgi:regulator of protease activity HflC (stomatin/prohibitin superfamily)